MGHREPWGTGSADTRSVADSPGATLPLVGTAGSRPIRARIISAVSVVAGIFCVGVTISTVTPGVLLPGLDAPSMQATGLATVLIVGGRGRSLGGLVGSIGAGALCLGAIAWLVTSQTGFLASNGTLAVGLGLAVGGGLGSVAWLVAVGEDRQDETEEVTVDMEEDDGPTPTPVDLFDASPDPILFFAEDADGPVVLAANHAFEGVFGVSGSALEGTPLAEGLLAAEGATGVVTAARDGGSFDRVLACETDDGQREMRVRLAVTDDPTASGGYVLYTPVEGR